MSESPGTSVLLRGMVEALLFVADSPLSESQLSSLGGCSTEEVHDIMLQWQDELDQRDSGISLRCTEEGWSLVTRGMYAPYVEQLLTSGGKGTLSAAALETLAVVAYQQPVTRAQVAAVRGVSVDGVMKTLMLRGLLREVGEDSHTGAVLWGTSSLFLEYFGLNDLSELPSLAPLLPTVSEDDDEEMINSVWEKKLSHRED